MTKLPYPRHDSFPGAMAPMFVHGTEGSIDDLAKCEYKASANGGTLRVHTDEGPLELVTSVEHSITLEGEAKEIARIPAKAFKFAYIFPAYLYSE